MYLRIFLDVQSSHLYFLNAEIIAMYPYILQVLGELRTEPSDEYMLDEDSTS